MIGLMPLFNAARDRFVFARRRPAWFLTRAPRSP